MKKFINNRNPANTRYILYLLFVSFLLLNLKLFITPNAEFPSTDNVIKHLIQLEKIADEHGSSRSVANGHLASVEYIVSVLQKHNNTLTVRTQDVPLRVQVDEQPPSLTLHLSKKKSITFKPRIELATASGSGSSKTLESKLLFVDDCSFTTKDKNFVAVLDPENREFCDPCDRMVAAIRHGAKSVIFLGTAGNKLGYPHSTQPSPGRCYRNEKYLDQMKLVGIVSLSDFASYEFVKMMNVYPKLKADVKVESAFREYISKNIIADSINGDENKVVVFGSHLDSVPNGPGINDDGSGAMVR